MTKKIPLSSVGEILYEEFMQPLGVSSYRLAKDIGVPTSRIQAIIHDRRKVTIETSIRLGRFFGVSDKYFLNLQNDVDLRKLLEEDKEAFDKIKPFQCV